MPIEGTVSTVGKLHKDFIKTILKPPKDKHFLSPFELKLKALLKKLAEKKKKKKGGGRKSKYNIKMTRKFRKRTRRKRGGDCDCEKCLAKCDVPPPAYEELEEEEPEMAVSFEPIGRGSWRNNPGLQSQEPELEDEPEMAVSFEPIGRHSLPPRGGRRRRKRRKSRKKRRKSRRKSRKRRSRRRRRKKR